MQYSWLRFRNQKALRGLPPAGTVDTQSLNGRLKVYNPSGLTGGVLAEYTAAAPVDPVAGAWVVTFAAAVPDAATVTIGPETYEFDRRGNGHVTAGNIAVDISATATAKKATGTITFSANASVATAADAITIGATTYTFETAQAGNVPSAAGKVRLGTTTIQTINNLVAAINGTDTKNTANATVSAAVGDGLTVVCTALVCGTGANAAAFTNSEGGGRTNIAMTGSNTLGGAGTTQAGVEPSQAECEAAFTSAVDDNSGYFDATDESGYVKITALTKGTAAVDAMNGYTCSTSNGSQMSVQSSRFGHGVSTVAFTADHPTAGNRITINNGTAYVFQFVAELGDETGSNIPVVMGDTHLTAAAAFAAAVNAAGITGVLATVASGTVSVLSRVATTVADTDSDANIGDPSNSGNSTPTTVTGGVIAVDGTPGIRGAMMFDASKLYICTTEGDESTAIWKEAAIS